MNESTAESRSEDREKRQECREERHEQREIIASRDIDELRFKRENDFENLAKIPSILLALEGIERSLTACDLPKVKTDVDWLKQFFWLLVGGVVTELIGIVGIVFLKLGR